MSIRQGSQILAGALIPNWVGTLSDYNTQQIETLHPDWVCFITDDDTSTLVDCYTKSASENLFAHRTGDNFTSAGTQLISSIPMPDWTHYDILTVLASPMTCIAPADGWFFGNGRISSGQGNLNLRYSDQTDYTARSISWVTAGVTSVMFPAKKNDEIIFGYSSGATDVTVTFIYAKGWEE